MVCSTRAGLSMVGVTLCFAIGMSGCATMSLPEYEPAPPSEFRARASVESLDVAAYAMESEQEVTTYFGANLPNEGVLPVLVVVSNHGPKSFLLRRDDVLLQAGPAVAGAASTAQSGVDSGGTGVAVAGAVLMSPILQFTGFKMMSDAQVIARNMAAKELQATTVSPGKTVHGFVYFGMTRSVWEQSAWTVRVRLRELGSDTVLNVDIQL